MECIKIKEHLEEYIMNELDNSTKNAVKEHLNTCDSCMHEYLECKEIVEKVLDMKNSLKLKESVFEMSKAKIIKYSEINKKRKKPFLRLFPNIAACVSLAALVLAGSVIAFPSFAANYTPELPIVKELVQARSENDKIAKENNRLKEENEQLKMEIKKIGDTEIKEVVTSKGIPAEENQAVQELVLEFIKAQYNGDLETIKSMCTDKFSKEVEAQKDHLLMKKKYDLVFSTITNVAKEGDKYYVFIRMTDGLTKGEAEFQQNFELVKENGKFLISFVGLDA